MLYGTDERTNPIPMCFIEIMKPPHMNSLSILECRFIVLDLSSKRVTQCYLKSGFLRIWNKIEWYIYILMRRFT